MRDFVKALNFYKTKYSDYLSKCKTSNEKLAMCNALNTEMNLSEPFKLSPEKLPNTSKRMFYKLMANALFGKLEQKNNKMQTLFLNKQSDIEEIYFSENKIDDIFCINDEICQVQIIPNTFKTPPNRKANCYLGAQVTAYARQIIYEHVQTVENSQAKIYQIDCDSIIFTLPVNSELPLNISSAVGHFKHELSGKIASFYSLGPKNYSISFQTPHGIETVSRVRGLSLSNSLNPVNFTDQIFKFYVSQFLKQKYEFTLLKQFRKKSDFKKLKISSALEQITFSNDLCKRRNIDLNSPNFCTIPYGYK